MHKGKARRFCTTLFDQTDILLSAAAGTLAPTETGFFFALHFSSSLLLSQKLFKRLKFFTARKYIFLFVLTV
jgi:hypothetical protein